MGGDAGDETGVAEGARRTLERDSVEEEKRGGRTQR